jgi:hypothetical protein
MKMIYLSVYIDKKEKEKIHEHAKKERMSLSAFMIKAAFEKIERDNKKEKHFNKMMA